MMSLVTNFIEDLTRNAVKIQFGNLMMVPVSDPATAALYSIGDDIFKAAGTTLLKTKASYPFQGLKAEMAGIGLLCLRIGGGMYLAKKMDPHFTVWKAGSLAMSRYAFEYIFSDAILTKNHHTVD